MARGAALPVTTFLADEAFAHARILAGTGGLSRLVEAVTIGDLETPAMAARDALLLAGPEVAPSDLINLVRHAASVAAAAFAFIDPPHGASLDATSMGRADEVKLPIIALPRGSDWNGIVRASNRLLLDHRRPEAAATADADGALVSEGTRTQVDRLVQRMCSAAGSETAALYYRTIGPLDIYDRERGAGLVNTLSVFFSWNESVERTAEALVTHRHTVRYRLVRIAEITGLSPYRTGDKALLWLGLQMRDLLPAGATSGSTTEDALPMSS